MHFKLTKKDWFAELKGGPTVATEYTVNRIMAVLISRKHINSVGETRLNGRQVVCTVGLHVRVLMSLKVYFLDKWR